MSSRAFLLAGFGGLLALMAVVGVDTLLVLRRVERANSDIRQDFLARNHSLNEIRSSLYLSGTDVRDLLLDPDPGAAETHRAGLELLRQTMTRGVAAYAGGLRPEEAAPFHGLERGLTEYWRALAPVLAWNAAERRDHGYKFLHDEVYPRRVNMLGLADQIAAVNEQQLEAGNRRVSELFSEFRSRLVLTLVITVLLGLLLAAFTIANTLRLETEAQTRFREMEQARGEAKELSARLLEAQEEERRNISRELHDEVGQAVSALLVETSNLANALPAGATPELQVRLDSMKRLAESTVAVVRNMALLLRPSMLDDIGLVPALRWQAREVSRRTSMRVDVAADLEMELPDECKTCVYRVTQEALHNASRHAAARVCRVTLHEEGGALHLAVQDDGKGFDMKQERGMGLLGVQERVARLGGTARITSAPGQGTLLTVRIPLKART